MQKMRPIHQTIAQRALWLILPVLLHAGGAFAQTLEDTRAKYKPLIEKAPNDTVLVKLLIDFSTDLSEENQDTALLVLDRAMQVSRKAGYRDGIGRVYCGIAGIIHNKGLFDSSRVLYQRALAFLSPNDHHFQGVAWMGIGTSHLQTGRSEEAVTAFFKGLEAVKADGEPLRMSHPYNRLALAFNQMDQVEKSLEYTRKADSLYVLARDTSNHVKMLINMGGKYDRLHRPREAAEIFREAYRVSDLARYQMGRFYGRVGIGELYARMPAMHDSSLYYLRAAEKISREFQVMPVYLSSMYMAFGLAYFEKGKFGEAKAYLDKSETILLETGHLMTLMDHYHLQTKVNIRLGLGDDAMASLSHYVKYRDSIQKSDVAAKLNEMETKYRTVEKDAELARKERDLARQQLDIRSRNAGLLALSGVVLLLLLGGGAYLLHIRQKQMLSAQKVLTLRREAELTKVQAAMEAEEKERARIARNLHDGAGSILSGVKLYLSSLESQYRDLAGSAAYRDTLGLLNEAVTEIRETSHNLMPKMLHLEGIHAAIRDYCGKIGRSGNLDVEFQSFGEPVRFDIDFELMIFRTVQELLGNVMKHAGAKHVIVQLSFHPDTFTLTVEDDGRGMGDKGAGSGIGMFAVNARVEAFRGTMDVDSSAGGTSITLQFPVQGEQQLRSR